MTVSPDREVEGERPREPPGEDRPGIVPRLAVSMNRQVDSDGSWLAAPATNLPCRLRRRPAPGSGLRRGAGAARTAARPSAWCLGRADLRRSVHGAELPEESDGVLGLIHLPWRQGAFRFRRKQLQARSPSGILVQSERLQGRDGGAVRQTRRNGTRGRDRTVPGSDGWTP